MLRQVTGTDRPGHRHHGLNRPDNLAHTQEAQGARDDEHRHDEGQGDEHCTDGEGQGLGPRLFHDDSKRLSP